MVVPQAEFTSRVERGFQATTFIQQGSIIANEVGAAGTYWGRGAMLIAQQGQAGWLADA
jgi:hypothetical protein